MQLKKLLPLIMLSSCGPHAPFVNDCLIDQSLMECSGRVGSPKAGITNYSLTPLKANKYICQSTADFLLSKLYIITLEKNLAKCVKTTVPHPTVHDCAVDGEKQLVYCSDGIDLNVLTWKEAYKYLCVSPTDFTLLSVYRKQLLEDIANCTP